ncbi:MAG: M28 family peptidase [Candidatus Lokiarchaeota archaeon]
MELINQILRIGSFYNIFFNITLVLLIIGIIPLISLFNFTSFGEKANKVPGAVDNLSAVSIILGIAKYLKEHKNIIPDNVEIQLISFGCEEAGLRGAYRYVEQHIEELKEYDTININMDALQNPNRISIIEYEPTTRTKHSKEVVESLIEIGKSIGLNTGKFGAGKKEKMIGQFWGEVVAKKNVELHLIHNSEIYDIKTGVATRA